MAEIKKRENMPRLRAISIEEMNVGDLVRAFFERSYRDDHSFFQSDRDYFGKCFYAVFIGLEHISNVPGLNRYCFYVYAKNKSMLRYTYKDCIYELGLLCKA